MGKGLFITFEGIDGCGKSLMAKKTASWLKSRGCDVLSTREPGGSELGKSIRKLLLNSAFGSINERSEAFFFAADRADHCSSVILPALESGKVVICDRFMDSTIAYQCYGRGISLDIMKQINDFAVNGLIPDRTILLDIDPAVAATRLRGERDRMEQEDRSFFNKVAEGYRSIAAAEPNRFAVISSDDEIETVFHRVKMALLPLLQG